MARIAIFASGTGSNFERLAQVAEAGGLGGEIVLLVCDRPGAAALEKAARRGIRSITTVDETEMLAQLQSAEVDLVVLAGFMRRISPRLISPYRGRIINLHPSLLPSFKGLDAIGQALAAGVRITGVTVHQVDEGLDTGRIIDQRALRVAPGETRERLEARIHELEHELLPQVVRELAKELNQTNPSIAINQSEKATA